MVTQVRFEGRRVKLELLIGARLAVCTPGASVSRGPLVALAVRCPGRTVSSGPMDGPTDGSGVVAAGAGAPATGGCSGAAGFFRCPLA